MRVSVPYRNEEQDEAAIDAIIVEAGESVAASGYDLSTVSR
jgi:hypothetical protein